MNETRRAGKGAFLTAILLLALHAPPSGAGNMTLSLSGSGLTTALEVTAFTTGISVDVEIVPGGGTTAGKSEFAAFSFTSPQSAGSALLARYASSGLHLQSAQLRIFSADGAQLLSQWVLNDAIVSAFAVGNGGPAQPRAAAPISFLPPVTSFSLRFRQYDYTVFNADGSVASRMCWDLATVKAC